MGEILGSGVAVRRNCAEAGCIAVAAAKKMSKPLAKERPDMVIIPFTHENLILSIACLED